MDHIELKEKMKEYVKKLQWEILECNAEITEKDLKIESKKSKKYNKNGRNKTKSENDGYSTLLEVKIIRSHPDKFERGNGINTDVIDKNNKRSMEIKVVNKFKMWIDPIYTFYFYFSLVENYVESTHVGFGHCDENKNFYNEIPNNEILSFFNNKFTVKISKIEDAKDFLINVYFKNPEAMKYVLEGLKPDKRKKVNNFLKKNFPEYWNEEYEKI